MLAVPDPDLTASYFRDALGFSYEWPEGYGWQLVSRDGVRIIIGYSSDTKSLSMADDHSYFAYFDVENIDDLFEELVQRGALISQPPTCQIGDIREFVIETPHGHRILVGQTLPGVS